ncbi:MAG: glycosyltransferase, partial [Flavobacterium sp.]
LSIYGKSDTEGTCEVKTLAKKLNIDKNVAFYEPVPDIESKYLEASFLLMTSRFEGFGMVLTEAMACGLPCIAYDCPCGPRAIINEGVNGFLIEDNNAALFAEKIIQLIEDEDLRIRLGENAKASVEKYNIDVVMQKWNQFFNSLK